MQAVLLSSCLINSVHAWALHLKGPLFGAMFKPLSIAIAVAMGVTFLGDELYLGSVIGAIVLSVGFYTVMWGKAKEHAIKDEVINPGPSSTSRSPLLQYHKNEDIESNQIDRTSWEILPYASLITLECTHVGLNTLYKAATLHGMSFHVFMAYSYAVAALLLLPAPFFSFKSRVLPPLNLSIVSKMLLMGIIGCTSQIMGFTGIIYSSPTLSSAISNLVPAFAFILAVIFRMEKLSFSNNSTRAKIFGTTVSVIGAFLVTLYKGPKIIWILSPFRSPSVSLGSSQDNWALGGLLFASEYILLAFWYIIQTQILKEYPAELTVVFFYNLFVSILSAIVGFFTVPDSSNWRIKPDIALASILCSAVLGSCFLNGVHAWALHLKGPLFVAMFKPLSIVIAVVMGVVFLGDDLYLGSVIGASILSIGFYIVMWGKAKEDVLKDEAVNVESSSISTSPLLQNFKTSDMESG